MKKLLIGSILLTLIINFSPIQVEASVKAPSYNYSYWGNSVAAPDAFSEDMLMTGDQWNIGGLVEPNDLFVTSDETIYILDSGNNRIVIINQDFQLVDTIDTFENDETTGTFANPQGIFVTEEKHIYIADTGNNRVVHLDEDYRLVDYIEKPSSELLKEDFVFQPVKVVVDNADRVYVMAAGVFDGFMEFNVNGEFNTFIGANRVQVDPIDLLWKRLSTKAQRSRMVMFIPTEFTSFDINNEGFIYATNADGGNDVIKKLNARGTDILRREGYYSPIGDIRYPLDVGPSRLIDIDITDSEVYSVLDAKQGRIFTYNGDGHLMFVFGGLGNQKGLFHTPVAIERIDDRFIVLDKALGEITVFNETEYGQTIIEANRSYYQGKEDQAFELYQKAIEMNANLEFAYTGIGKALLRQGDYKGAMENFKQSLDQKNYSKAFLLYRKEQLKDYFPTLMTLLLVSAIGITGFRMIRKSRKKREGVAIE
ncbi:hypothetical protein ACFOZ1_13325 [Gracilibacillus marinus]|uniref:NHL repeat-containing protein n=1 Tax=Gracilibacillus marinus TaxID=630535 RepID=A0ABV8VW91_9BACI